MAYESPIRLVSEIENKIFEDQKEGVYKAVLSYRVDISKDELFKLLYGDRKQYEKGYEDGRRSRDREIVRCEDCVSHGTCRYEQYLGLCGYCSKGERRPIGEDPSHPFAESVMMGMRNEVEE